MLQNSEIIGIFLLLRIDAIYPCPYAFLAWMYFLFVSFADPPYGFYIISFLMMISRVQE